MGITIKHEGSVWTPTSWGFKNEMEYPFPFEFFTSEFGRTLIALCIVRKDWDAIARALSFSGRDELHPECLWLEGEKWTYIPGKQTILRNTAGQEKQETALVKEMKKAREKIKDSDKRHRKDEERELYSRAQRPQKTAGLHLNIPT
jgi:hypothetical protein